MKPCGTQQWFLAGLLPGPLLLLLLLLPANVAARPNERFTDPSAYSIRQEGFFRVKFMREGEAAPPPADANADGCPDFVEDVLAQLVTAHRIFCEVGGLRSPLESPRYAGVQYIDVEIRSRSDMRGNNGLAYDEIVQRPNANDTVPIVPVLLLAVNRNIDPKKNLTPAHEYFHQIQNGMTRFKNPWFYEGMARWSETMLNPLHQNTQQLPSRQTLRSQIQNAAWQEKLFAASYTASTMLWAPLASLHSDTLAGLGVMKRVLERLAATENIPFIRYNYATWTEANQRRPENNPYIMDAVVNELK